MSNPPKLTATKLLHEIFDNFLENLPQNHACIINPIKYPKVGCNIYPNPPPEAKTGTPANPRKTYTNTTVPPKLAPNTSPANKVNKN